METVSKTKGSPAASLPPEGGAVVVRIKGLYIERHDAETGDVFSLSVPEFVVRPNDRIGFVGESGSGKTTFLELLGLLGAPDRLERFDLSPYGDGRPMDLVPPVMSGNTNTLTAIRSRVIGFILQDGGLLPYLNVFENAHLAMELAHGVGKADAERIDAVGTALGLGKFLHRFPASLSGGQRQRAAVLRAMAPGAILLIGDEPTASLDETNSRDVMRLLNDSASSFGASVVLASHNERLLRDFGYRIFRVSIDEKIGARHATLVAEHNS